MENLKDYADYAPFIVIILMFFLKNKFFVTPEQLEKKHKSIIEEAEKKFVSLLAYQEFRHSAEKKFDELIQGVTDIKNFLINSHENK